MTNEYYRGVSRRKPAGSGFPFQFFLAENRGQKKISTAIPYAGKIDSKLKILLEPKLMFGKLFKKKYSTAQFWDWFVSNKAKFATILNVEQNKKRELVEELTQNLHYYCDSLFAQLGGEHGETLELIITAEGRVEYFEKVNTLINAAPEIEGWSFIAFIPPISIDFNLEFEDVTIDPKEVRFSPLINFKHIESIGINVMIPNYDSQKNSNWLEPAVYKMLDLTLGKKIFAQDIEHIIIGQLDENKKDNLMKLEELLNYVILKKETYKIT